VQTHVSRHSQLDLSTVFGHLETLRARAAGALSVEGFDSSAQRFSRTADLRYFGQAFEVRVPLRDGPSHVDTADAVNMAEAADTVEAAVAAFHDAHEQLYGYCFRDKPRQEVEWVNLRVTGIGPIQRPRLRPLSPSPDVPQPSGVRDVCFDAAVGFVPTPTYWRPDLPAGVVVDGPAVIEEYGSTVPLHRGFTATVDRLANLVITRLPEGGRS
jgi:N-methylhydantoinase A